MSCDAERVTGYVDDVLSPTERADVEAHLVSCPACREQVEFERELHGRLRGLAAVELPAGLTRAVRRRLRPSRARWLRATLPLAAGLVLFVLWVRATPAFLSWELARDHLHCFGKPKLPAKVWSSDPRRVAGWFEKEGTSLPVVPESAGGVELVGARYCPLIDRSVAHLYYSGADLNLSLYVVPGSVRMGGFHGIEAMGQTVHLLRVGGTVVGVVSSSEEAVEAVERSLTSTTAHRPGQPPDLGKALRVALGSR